jgi:hypothetical protein
VFYADSTQNIMLLVLAIILILFWLIGLFAHIAGGLIHLVLVVLRDGLNPANAVPSDRHRYLRSNSAVLPVLDRSERVRGLCFRE